MASNVRWLSTASYTELTTRLGNSTASGSQNIDLKEKTSPKSPSLLDQAPKEINSENIYSNVKSASPSTALDSIAEGTKLPPIPSFSEFINSDRAKGSQLLTSKNHSADSMQKNREKRARYQ